MMPAVVELVEHFLVRLALAESLRQPLLAV